MIHSDGAPATADTQLERDRQTLIDADARGGTARLGAYLRLSGPGWLQSALTLGGGSLASSLYLGVIAGVSMMWLQPVAMILGIVMLCAISYVTLSTGERPFRAINRHVNPVLGWSWLLASLAANMIWALPQYSLCFGVLEQNLLPGVLGEGGALAGDTGKWAVSAALLAFSTVVVWSYGSGGWGIRLYELSLKIVVAMIVLCFVGVVVKLSASGGQLDWAAIGAGFIPNLRQLSEPAAAFRPLLDAIGDTAARAYWTDYIVSSQRDVMFSAAATAVGINMTFLLPYSMLSRGWDKSFRGLATFDLSTGMLIPFVLATSCVIIAAASQFHGKAPAVVDETDGAYLKMIEQRGAALPEAGPAEPPEKQLATMLLKRDAKALAKALTPLTGATTANVVFGLGVVGMTLSTISLLMLVSGFVTCEILDRPSTGWPFRLGCLLAASGALWPLFWTGDARFYLAIVASLFGGALLPIAYCTFFLLMNQRSLLGDELPRGARRLVWNLLMLIAAGSASLASVYVLWTKSKSETGTPVYGVGVLAALLAAIAIGQMMKKPAIAK